MRPIPSTAVLLIVALGSAPRATAQANVTFEIPVNISGVSPDIIKIGVTCMIGSEAFTAPQYMQGAWSNLSTNQFSDIYADKLYPNASRQEFWISGSLNITARVVVAIPADWLNNPVGKNAMYGCAVLGMSKTTMKWGMFSEQSTDLAYKLKLTPPSYEGTFVW